MSYLICDPFCNYIQHDGKFMFSAYGSNKGVPMEFKTFDDASEYIDLHFNEEEREDLYIKEN